MKAPLVPAALAAVALAFAACGEREGTAESLTQAEYQDEVLAIAADSTEATSLFFELVTAGEGDCRRLVEQFRAEIQRLVERADRLEPPAEVADIHDRFVDAGRRGVDELSRVEKEVEAERVRCGRPMNDRLYEDPALADADDAIAALEREGYTVLGR